MVAVDFKVPLNLNISYIPKLFVCTKALTMVLAVEFVGTYLRFPSDAHPSSLDFVRPALSSARAARHCTSVRFVSPGYLLSPSLSPSILQRS